MLEKSKKIKIRELAKESGFEVFKNEEVIELIKDKRKVINLHFFEQNLEKLQMDDEVYLFFKEKMKPEEYQGLVIKLLIVGFKLEIGGCLE